MISADSGGTFTTYTYDYRNRLTEVTQGGTVIATYTYNALDQRIGVQEGGSRTWTVYNGTSADADALCRFQRIGHAADSLSVRAGRDRWGGCRRDPGPDELGRDDGVVSDRQAGSVRDIVSSSGSVLDHIVYDSFGNILTETNASNGDRFKFAGMQYDSTTGQYYDQCASMGLLPDAS